MLIGLVGFSQSGKDTVADILVDKLAYVKCGFADNLKDYVSDLFDIKREWLDDENHRNRSLHELGGKTIREVLQYFATNVVRSINPNLWVDKLKWYISGLINYQTHNIVVKDVRFQNEMDMIINNGGVIIYIEKPGIIPNWIYKIVDLFGANKFTNFIVYLWDDKYAHESEFNTFYFRTTITHTIINDGTIEELESKVLNLISNYESSIN